MTPTNGWRLPVWSCCLKLPAGRLGLRMILQDGTVVHIRASGNAPELRLYVEAASDAEAYALMRRALGELRKTLAR